MIFGFAQRQFPCSKLPNGCAVIFVAIQVLGRSYGNRPFFVGPETQVV